MAYDYDVLVIGGGPGGYVAAIECAKAGRRTALIEEDLLGGTCLNRGCIPTKTLAHSAALLGQLRRAESFGLCGADFGAVTVDMPRLREHKRAVSAKLVGGVRSLLQARGVTLLPGRARLLDRHTAERGAESVSAEYLILAAGSKPYVPAWLRLEDGASPLTSTEALELDRVPGSMAILGGGVVGLELAGIFKRFGCRVTVLELLDEVLPTVDPEIAALARRRLERDGVRVERGAAVSGIRGRTVLYTQGGAEKCLETEEVLLALGRVPNAESLGAGEIGLAMKDGAIVTDGHMRSSVENVYAVGDINGRSMLAQTAFREGQVAAANICGAAETMDYTRLPYCAYTQPELASVGLTESAARERCGEDLKIGRFPLTANGRALTEGESEGLFKVLADGRSGEILGAHLFGAHATELISEVTAAMWAEATVEEMIAAVRPHPTLSEAVNEAFLAAWTGSAIHSL